ncbi:uncharacterized protein LOC144104056 isoform X2 [Amblyomma americanum]
MFAMNVAPSSMQYTLVGFFTELDWRPLLFVKPLPPNRICGACGLVRPKTMLLPCAHSLCQPCYDQCAQEGFHTCPFDSHKCQDEDVITIVFSADELLRREIRFTLDSIDPSSVCISAAGLFTVNLQLLVSIAGASITYTVILVQTSA